MLMITWMDLCYSGVKLQNWKPFYNKILKVIQDKSFSPSNDQALKFYKAIEVTTKFYASDF